MQSWHSSAQLGTSQHGTARHSTAQHSTAQHSTAQHSTTQHNTTQHNTTQHSTAQHRTANLEMRREGSCTRELEACPALRASRTSRMGTNSCITTASLSLLALMARFTNSAQNWRQYSTEPCDLRGPCCWEGGWMSWVGPTPLEGPLLTGGISTVCSCTEERLSTWSQSGNVCTLDLNRSLHVTARCMHVCTSM